MLRPQLLPDEIVGSYVGALIRINGVRGRTPSARIASLLQVVDGWSSRLNGTSAPSTPFERLAAVAEIDSAHLKQHHTLQTIKSTWMTSTPIESAAASADQFFKSELVRPEVCLCLDCVASDLDAHGRSYWRREHQLPGIYWCPKHKRALNAVRDRHALLSAPSSLVSASVEFDYEWAKALWSHKGICKYLDVLGTFLDSSPPKTAPAIRDALRLVAKPLGYQTSPQRGRIAASTRSILSRDVHERFPNEWLARTFHAWKPPAGSKLQVWLDGTLWMTIPPTNAAGYALAASMLFSSGDAFVQALRERDLASECPNPSGRQRGSRTGSEQKVRAEYVNEPPDRQVQAKAKNVGPRGRRRTLQQKAALVQRSYESGKVVDQFAREAGVPLRTLAEWRRLEKQGAFAKGCAEPAVSPPELAAALAEIARLKFCVDELRQENEGLKQGLGLATATC